MDKRKFLFVSLSGLIGDIAWQVLKEGHDVVVIDNESTGRLDNVPPGVRYVKGDVTCPQQLEPAFVDGLDAVFDG